MLVSPELVSESPKSTMKYFIKDEREKFLVNKRSQLEITHTVYGQTDFATWKGRLRGDTSFYRVYKHKFRQDKW